MQKDNLLPTTNLFYVKSRRWFRGYVMATSSLDAVFVAIGTGLHKKGKAIEVLSVPIETISDDALRFTARESKHRSLRGRILRKPTGLFTFGETILITPTTSRYGQ